MTIDRRDNSWICALIALLALPNLATAQTCNLDSPTCPGTGPCGFSCASGPLAGCAMALPIAHQSAAGCASPGGAFDLIGTVYENTCGTTACVQAPPPLRFWGYNEYMTANYGCGAPGPSPGGEWLANLGADFGIGTNGHWVLYQTNWQGCALDGCPTGRRTVAEISAVDAAREGSINHDSWYLIASVDQGPGGYDFDRVRGGILTGSCSEATIHESSVDGINILGRTAPCRGSTVTTFGTFNPDMRYTDMMVSLVTRMPDSYSEAGLWPLATPVVAGYQIVFVTLPWGVEPTSSDPSVVDWQPTHDPTDPSRRAAVIPLNTPGPFTVTFPTPAPAFPPPATWLATRLVYFDATVNPTGTFTLPNGPRLMSPVSEHCGPIEGYGDRILAVTFDSVTAVRTSAGVLIRWSTSHEDDVVGFAVMRQRAGDATEAAVELTKDLATAHGPFRPYEFVDTDVTAATVADYVYYIQEWTGSGIGARSPAVVVSELNAGGASGNRRHRQRSLRPN